MKIGRWMEDEDEGVTLLPWEMKNFALLYRAKRNHAIRRARITWFIKHC